jgi:hypothetical protein
MRKIEGALDGAPSFTFVRFRIAYLEVGDFAALAAARRSLDFARDDGGE